MNFIFLYFSFKNTHNVEKKHKKKTKNWLNYALLKFAIPKKLPKHNLAHKFWFTNAHKMNFIFLDLPFENTHNAPKKLWKRPKID